jgi:hypothetical protein
MFGNQRRILMRSTIKDAILKRLHIIYWQALIRNRWPVALLGREGQAKDRRRVEKQSNPCPYPSKIRGLKDGAEENLRNFMAALKKLYPHREHPHPWPIHNTLESPLA